MVAITKKREAVEGKVPCWRIYCGGHRTSLVIEKAEERPKWGQSHVYVLADDDADEFIMSGSVERLMATLKHLREALA